MSVGALYNHFKDRGEIVVAVYALDDEYYDREVQPTSWATYVARLRLHATWLQDRQMVRGLRLSHEFLAELIQQDTRPAGYENLLERSFQYFRDPLAAAYAAGESALPLGLDATARLHRQLCWGMMETVLRDRGLDPAEIVEEFVRGLGLLAGLEAPQRGLINTVVYGDVGSGGWNAFPTLK